eukprot:2989150-Prymnesium_polylepis.1
MRRYAWSDSGLIHLHISMIISSGVPAACSANANPDLKEWKLYRLAVGAPYRWVSTSRNILSKIA